MTLLIIGRQGQVATALIEKAKAAKIDTIVMSRPDIDLASSPETITDALVAAGTRASVIVNAAAYTAVDRAETEPDLANAINGAGAGAVAQAAERLGIPVIHLSTDYVFDGDKTGAWLETDRTGPLGVYGQSKLAGEKAVEGATRRHLILRTAWVYSPFGQNFVKTMLRLGRERDRLTVVSDQTGSPTSAFDIADGVLAMAETLRDRQDDGDLYGVFHLAGTGETSWADFARAIFEEAATRGHPIAEVVSIPTSDYPTPAARPQNSVLSTDLLWERYGLRLPHWRTSLKTVLDRLITRTE